MPDVSVVIPYYDGQSSLDVLTGHVDRLILLLGNCDWVSLRHDCSD